MAGILDFMPFSERWGSMFNPNLPDSYSYDRQLPMDKRGIDPNDIPLADRWAPVSNAVAGGLWDPQGTNFSNMFTAPFGGGQQPGAPMPPPRPPMPMPDPQQQPGNPDIQLAGNNQPAPPQTLPRTQTLGLPDMAPPGGDPSMGARLNAGFGGLAASKGQGLIGRLFNLGAGLATGKRQDPTGMALEMQQRNQAATLKALIESGVPEPVAKAAALNPELLKTIAPEYFGGFKVVDIDDGPLGKTKGVQGAGGAIYPMEAAMGQGGVQGYIARGGRAIRPGGASPLQPAGGGGFQPVQFNPDGTPSQGAGSPAGGEIGFLKGFNWKESDPEKFISQLSNLNGGEAVQAAVRSYLNGDVMPTGNPRKDGIANAAKVIAQRFAQLSGMPAPDSLYAEKHKYRTELGSNSPSSAGGQSKAFIQGIEHAVDLGQTLKSLDNWNGFGIPAIAAVGNTIRQAASNNQQALADKAAGIGQTLAGEVGKLFSGSAGGGVHEREMTRARFSTVRSKPQLAAALEATLETMEGGLTSLEANRDRVLGPKSGVELIPQKTRERVNELRQIISDLKGGEGGGAKTQSNETRTLNGKKYNKINGQWFEQ